MPAVAVYRSPSLAIAGVDAGAARALPAAADAGPPHDVLPPAPAVAVGGAAAPEAGAAVDRAIAADGLHPASSRSVRPL